LSHLHLGLPRGVFLSGFPTKGLPTFLISPMRATHCQSHSLWLDHLNIWRSVKLRSSSLCSLLQPPGTSSFLCPNSPLSTLFSNTLNLCSSLSVKDQVSH
jgi:hypothetical protein